tara:strand:- start:11829 stop:12071 length:243 start_codon:yes stop_codon:yes gene_type:complete
MDIVKGVVKTYGPKAITIETEDKYQYYALMANVHHNIKEQLNYPLPILPVKFHPVTSMTAGKTIKGPRYFAVNVELDVEF